MAYSPVGRMGVKHKDSPFESLSHPYVISLAEKYQKSAVQIVLQWGIARGYCVIPKAASNNNQVENFESQLFKLTNEEVS